THTLRNGTQMSDGSGGGVGETARLHCSDCHLSETNAHGAENAWHMLLNGTPGDFDTDEVMSGGVLDTVNSSVVCYKCHNVGEYSEATAGLISRFDHNDDANVWPMSYGAEGGDKGAELGPTCLICHGGNGFGRIHGRGSSTDGDDLLTFTTDMGTYGKYRFMPGAYMTAQPGLGATDAAWEESGTALTCYFNPSSTWSPCAKHDPDADGAGVSNYGRAPKY
ncbi:hypothetical protein KAR91_10275, partial [Candidatus Pacearchaeota archaeon]|nr:hypothetical protein [Candidatus Pacearchaeota archaeon]